MISRKSFMHSSQIGNFMALNSVILLSHVAHLTFGDSYSLIFSLIVSAIRYSLSQLITKYSFPGSAPHSVLPVPMRILGFLNVSHFSFSALLGYAREK